MLTVIVIFYSIVVLMGLFLFINLFTSKKIDMLVGIVHGSLGLIGIAMLIFYISFISGDSPYLTILLFVTALFFGGGMLAAKLSGKRFPVWIALIHALIAAAGFSLLVQFWIG
ncbi:MAG: hypothetical protein JSS91_06350 [Bacteroidetes bacterium]|nr:hypothetical protein [Bacteroidota bacterium]